MAETMSVSYIIRWTMFQSYFILIKHFINEEDKNISALLEMDLIDLFISELYQDLPSSWSIVFERSIIWKIIFTEHPFLILISNAI